MTLLYGNENFDQRVIEHLRNLGYDVLTAREAGKANQRIPDEQVLEFAIAENRAVLTFNGKDFFKLHKTIPDHKDIVACTYIQIMNVLRSEFMRKLRSTENRWRGN